MWSDVSVCYVFPSAIGFTTNALLSHFMPSFPYTVMMMLLGIFLGLLHRGTDRGLGVLSDSIHAWDLIDPHLLMYSFIPALLFGGEYSVITRLAR